MIHRFAPLRLLNAHGNAASARSRTGNISQVISRSLFNYKDPFLLENQLTDDENAIKDVAYNFSKDYLLPNVVSSFRNEKFDKNIMKEMGSVG